MRTSEKEAGGEGGHPAGPVRDDGDGAGQGSLEGDGPGGAEGDVERAEEGARAFARVDVGPRDAARLADALHPRPGLRVEARRDEDASVAARAIGADALVRVHHRNHEESATSCGRLPGRIATPSANGVIPSRARAMGRGSTRVSIAG